MATEETKPVEREAFEAFNDSEIGSGFVITRYPENDPDLPGYYRDERTQAAWESWQASADAALERAAQRIDEYFSGDPCTECEDLRDAIRALKGSRDLVLRERKKWTRTQRKSCNK